MDFIEGHEKVTSIFGRWPTFHDGVVERFDLQWDAQGANVRLSIRGWESTGEVDESGYYRLHKHTLVEMSFKRCTDLRVELPEGTLNIVYGLRIEQGETEKFPLRVILDGIGGLDASFRCAGGEVIRAEPYQPERSS